MERILVVDDDVSILKVLQMRLESEHYAVVAASEIREAKERIAEGSFDIALLDLKLDGGTGIELMMSLREVDPDLPVIILTAYGTIESAVEAMKEGAYSYLTKPFDYRELLIQIRNGIEKAKLSREVKRLRSMLRVDFEGQSIIGQSEAMKRVFEAVALAAETDSNVFISGESGTGKGLVAKALHQLSERKDKPFVPINCAAIPATLLESELFGFEKGAFTGAIANKKGLFVQADGGIIFLDEISEIPPPMQGKLLKALEEKEFYPLGSHRTAKVDVRIVSASNKDIEKEVEKGTFRGDLFYRVHVIPIRVPPLRERKEDIPLLVEHFLDKVARKLKRSVKGLSPAALQKLMIYSWPGNVRELENMIECAVVMTPEEIIPEEMIILPGQELGETAFKTLKVSKQDFEKNYLIQLMKISRGNVSQASKLAGKYRADLYELLEKYRINPLDFRQE
jgi:two-component system response regulator GlrR